MHDTGKYSQKRALLFFVLCGAFPQLSYATTAGNYAEMILALASIPVDVAAHAQDAKKNTNTATRLHLVVDVLNLLNKSFFFYNQKEAGCLVHGMNKELAVNGALMGYDVVTLCQHINSFVHTKTDTQGSLDLQHGHIMSWRVVGIPVLKGLAAFSLACLQENATGYADRQARVVATATHSFFTLLDEYVQLDPASPYKKIMYAGLLAHAGWLVYEWANMVNNFSASTAQFNKQELKNILDTRVGGITCVRGYYPQPLTAAEIKGQEKRLEDDLACRGLRFIRADGHYNGGHIPNSYIILGIQEADLIALANQYCQSSVVTFNKGSAKLVYLMGPNKDSFCEAKSWTELANAGQDCTEVRAADGTFRFTYNFDFTKRQPVS